MCIAGSTALRRLSQLTANEITTAANITPLFATSAENTLCSEKKTPTHIFFHISMSDV